MNTQLLQRLAATGAATLALAACGDDAIPLAGSDAANLDADAGDAALGDALAPDGGPIDASAGSCDSISDARFEVFPDGPTTQIHADAAWAGDGVWVIFGTRGTSAPFDIWLTKIGCDGSTLVAPRIVNEGAPFNAVEPQVAVNGDRVLTAWSTDNGAGPNNLDIVTRAYDASGTALDDARTIEMSRAGEPQAGNAWMPDLAASGDGFTLVGSWGHDAAVAFQVFVQQLDLDGVPRGDAIDVSLEPPVGQLYPSVSVGDDDVAWVSWTRATDAGEEAWFARVADGQVDGPYSVGGGRVAPHIAPGWIATAGSDGVAPIEVVSAAAEGLLGTAQAVSSTGRHYAPAIALSGDDAAVAWYTDTASASQVWMSAIGDGATSVRVDIAGQAAAYALSLTPVADGAAFLTLYSAGTSPDFRLYGRFVAP